MDSKDSHSEDKSIPLEHDLSEDALDEALEETFPASDPIAVHRQERPHSR